MTSCRDRLIEMPELVKNICRLLYYKHLTRLCSVAVECVSALATDPVLQMHFLQVNTPRTPVLLQLNTLGSF
jgi:DnaJ family protein C protein 13